MTAVLPDVGDVLDGRYQLLRDLGRGAAGAVFEARHLFTGRIVAVKMVMPRYRGANIPELRARLQREGRALATVHHPGVVEILDAGVTLDGSPFLVMELLQGRTLEGLITARGRLPIPSSVAVALQICDALDAVHKAGIVHRDVKPSNIVVLKSFGGHEVAKLVDFGIARLDQPSEDKLTARGAILGTPAYLAPEHLLQQDSEPHPASDVYSVGVTLYECIAGALPYSGNLGKILLSVAKEGPPSSISSFVHDIPQALAAVIDRSIAKSRADRYQTARELAAALEAAVPGEQPRIALLGPPPVPEDATADQRRRLLRAPYNTPVRITFGDSGIDGRTEDISERGVLVLSFVDLAPTNRVGLRFALPMDGKIAAVEADVRWVRHSDNPRSAGMRAIGLEFVAPPAELQSSVGRYVELMSDQ